MKPPKLLSLKFTRLVLVGLAILAFFVPGSTVSAHPADMYAQQQAVRFSPAGLQVDWKITPGPLLAGSLWQAADLDGDNRVDAGEAQAWFKPYASRWQAQLDGQPLGDPQGIKVAWPANLVNLQAGDTPIEVQFQLNWPAGLGGKHRLVLHNTFQEAISLNWFSLNSQPDPVFDQPDQNNGELSLELYFAADNPAGSAPAAALSTWESGRPDLPGFNGVLSAAASRLGASGQGANPAASQANPISALLSLMRSPDFSPLFLLGAFLLSLALGSLHALTPGHGKALVAAYLVGSPGRACDAVLLGLVVTLTHTGSVLVLGLVTLVASRYVLPGLIIPWLEVVSGLFVVAFGLDLLVRRGRALYAWIQSERKPAAHLRPAQNNLSDKQEDCRAAENTRLEKTFQINKVKRPAPLAETDKKRSAARMRAGSGHPPAPRSSGVRIRNGYAHDSALSPDQGAPHSHGGALHSHSHPLADSRVTWKSLLTLGVSGGLVPCPDAIAILLVALALNRILFGMLLITAFSIGLALVLIAIGIAMVQGARFLSRSAWMEQVSVYVPLASAAAVVVLGVGLTLTTLFSGALASPAGAPQAQNAPGFDPARAKLLYLAPDRNFVSQLTLLPLAGGDPLPLTRETNEILGFRLSPDGKSILYSTLNTSGETSIWTMAPDGSAAKKLLDCPQSYCAGAEWFPGGHKIVYERRNYARDAVMLLYSTWWLDLDTGQTRPVFRDTQFPSLAPQFSFDGQWLGYISPASNTLQSYNLANGQNLSQPYLSGMPQAWSPLGLAFLYWDQVTRGEQVTRHLMKYDLLTRQSTRLGGGENQDDSAAAWSPDGRWIALIRLNQQPAGGASAEQVWLVRPDGSEAHVLLNQDKVSYGGDLGWSPDSQSIVYSLISYARNPDVSEIWTANIQSGQQKQLASGGNQAVFLP